MKKVLVAALILAACSNPQPKARDATRTAPAAQSASPATTVRDFHAEWCAAVLIYARVPRGVEALQDRRAVRGLDKAVKRLDELSFALSDAGLDGAADVVWGLSDAIAEEADVVHEAGGSRAKAVIETLDDLNAAQERISRALGPAIAEMGHC